MPPRTEFLPEFWIAGTRGYFYLSRDRTLNCAWQKTSYRTLEDMLNSLGSNALVKVYSYSTGDDGTWTSYWMMT